MFESVVPKQPFAAEVVKTHRQQTRRCREITRNPFKNRYELANQGNGMPFAKIADSNPENASRRHLDINSTLRKSAPYLILFGFWLALIAMKTSESNSFRPAAAQEETSWRKTRFGWQDMSAWNQSKSQATYRIELIHPVIFSASIVMFSIAVLIWATEEYDWGRLFVGKEPSSRNPLQPSERTECQLGPTGKLERGIRLP